MNLKLNYETLCKLTNEEIMSLFETLTKFNLYSMSTDWRNDREYILKMKGGLGDIIISWI